ncbi:hypothetical protein ACMU_00855 [Actibacterium mucosum KCTC 23349]|uniref:Uncharacterized protein n=1 Tax=Actibacterium mucosum KCTC 23349 TaxID=1454373 RepID=A0A037ZQE6_9RHOB|nr:hypothetical protein ACMU_00855 [Actibacterium mucosum KCTC 23349]
MQHGTFEFGRITPCNPSFPKGITFAGNNAVPLLLTLEDVGDFEQGRSTLCMMCKVSQWPFFVFAPQLLWGLTWELE